MTQHRAALAGLTTVAIIAGTAVGIHQATQSPSHPQLPTIHGAVQHQYSQQYLCTYGTRFIRAYPKGMEPRHGFERDHLIPLSVGGAPRSPQNVWYEPWDQAHAADAIEYRAYREACTNQLTQRQAQRLVIRWKEKHG